MERFDDFTRERSLETGVPSLRLLEMIAWRQMRGRTFPDAIFHRIRKEAGRRGRVASILFELISSMPVEAQIRRLAKMVRSLINKRYPEDPYAMVTASTRPRLPRSSGSVAVDPYEY